MRIPFKRLMFGYEIQEEVDKLLGSGMIGLGEKVFEFERELAKYLGCKYVVCTDSCTSALFLSLKYRNYLTVSIPSMTVPLVADAILESGHDVVFNGETDWVGNMYRLGGTKIYDSAHELSYKEYTLFDDDTILCFSFYPTKPIGSADGGAIATNDEKFAKWARQISTYGRNQQAKYGNSWDYDVEMIGYKRHWTNLQAIVALVQLKHLPETDAKRYKVLNKFNNAFGLQNKSMYLYRIEVEKRDQFIKYMADKGMECGVHFKPLHMMKAFSEVPFETPEQKSYVKMKYEKTVSLPFYDTLTETETDEIIRAVKGWGQ